MADPQQSDPTRPSGPEERDYLLKRADDHDRLSAQTTDAGSRAIHLRLARLYRDRAADIALVLSD